MNDRRKTILIGLFVSMAIAIGISIILFLKPDVGDGKKLLYVRFSNIAGINVGTRVTFAGKPVGEVIGIAEIANARESAAHASGLVYFYQLTLKVDSSIQVYNTDDIAMRTTGLMGERSIAILPKAPLPGKIATPVTTQVVYASSIDPLENTFSQIARVAAQVQELVGHLDQWFKENGQPLSSAIHSFDGTMTQAKSVLGAVNDEKLVPLVRESVGLLSGNLKLLHESLDEDQLLHKASHLIEGLDESVSAFNKDGVSTLSNLEQISRDIAKGTGTIGRMLNSEDFYLRLTSITSKAETLMNDINHYGILFQYDKGWQRSRTKKANLLQSLDTPREFRAYFEGEVDTIQTSLGRLTELLDRAGGQEEKERILSSEHFKRDFMQFFNQAQALSDSIKLYSQKLVASGVGAEE